MATHLAAPEQSGFRLATRRNLKSRRVLTMEEQSALSRRLFEVILAGMPYSQAATMFGMCQQNCRRRFFRVARLAVGRLSPTHRLEPPFHEQHVTVMRQHKDVWLRAYDHALEPIAKSECQESAAVSLSQ